MQHSLPPSLRAGNGLPGRQVALCDGRTSLRADNRTNGYDLLTHYAPDSWGKLARTLVADDCAMTWTVDGQPHVFEWTEVYPFGLVNRERRGDCEVCSTVTVRQGLVLFEFSGVGKAAEFAIPQAMFRTCDEKGPNGEAYMKCDWELGAGHGTTWHAVRHEAFLFRDMSTYSAITGKQVECEPRTSELHLVIGTDLQHKTAKTAEATVFVLTPDSAGRARLAIGLGATREEAQGNCQAALEEGVFAQQLQRYRDLATETPKLDFGRHTAMAHFADLFPGYLESMRIADDPAMFRANNDYYWVWGWDMTRPAFGILTANRHAPIRDLLLLHRAQDGYINEYDNTLTKDLRWTPGLAGGLEFMLAHQYASWSGDTEGIRPVHESFARALREQHQLAGPTGMAVGDAASTDFPEEFGRTFRAWLAYTVAWSYGGYLSAEKLFLAWDDAESAEMARDLAMRIKRNFVPVFWNETTGFWNEGVHPSDPDLVCDIPLSTALAAMDSPYGEDLYGDKLAASARFARDEFLREDGVHITRRGEVRGWKEWTRQPNNWFAANDTMLTRLFRAVGDLESLEKLFYLYEINFGYQPAAFEGKPFRRPLYTSGSWQAFGAASWYRNLVEGAAGLWADLGGLTLRPGGLGEPVELRGLKCGNAIVDFRAEGQGLWPETLTVDGVPVLGTTKLPPLSDGRHEIRVTYCSATPSSPVLTLATDAKVLSAACEDARLIVKLGACGYTAVSFFSPGQPKILLNDRPIQSTWASDSRRGQTSFVLEGEGTLVIGPA